MKTVSLSEFRKKASDVLDHVEQGETFQIFRHGKAIAKIVPIPTRVSKPAWKHPGLQLVMTGVSLSKTILEERKTLP